jgi:aminopeptidase N
MASDKSFAHLWLSEGFASYFTDLYMEHTYGVDSARRRLDGERGEVIDFARTSTHAVVDSSSDLMSLLNANSYQKGAWVLHMLRQEVGDTVFRKIIQSYYQQYKGANADTRDFEKQAEIVSGKELTWFFEQWLYRPGVPEIAVKWKADGKQVKIELKQLQEQIYQLPLELTIILKDGKQQTQKIFLKEKEASIKMDLSGEPVQVIADPDIKLLADIRVSKQ